MNLNVDVLKLTERVRVLEENVEALQRTITILTEPPAKPQQVPQRKTG